MFMYTCCAIYRTDVVEAKHVGTAYGAITAIQVRNIVRISTLFPPKYRAM